MRIFQIGNIPLPRLRDKVSEDYVIKGNFKTEKIARNNIIIISSNKYIFNIREVAFKASLIGSLNRQYKGLVNSLNQYIDRKVPIIAYDYVDDEYNVFAKNKSKLIQWYICEGSITNVKVANDSEQQNPKILTANIKLITYWESLSEYFWDYGYYNQKNSYYTDINTINRSYFPETTNYFNFCGNDCEGFRPVVVKDFYKTFDLSYLNYFSSENSIVNTDNKRNYNFDVDIEKWNMPLKSVHIFEGFNSNSDIYIDTNCYNGINEQETKRTRVDVNKTNNLLTSNGYSILDSNDKIIIGDFEFINNNNVIRNTAIIKNGFLINIQPYVVYADYFPAMVTPSSPIKIDVITDVTSYYNFHIFRKI